MTKTEEQSTKEKVLQITLERDKAIRERDEALRKCDESNRILEKEMSQWRGEFTDLEDIRRQKSELQASVMNVKSEMAEYTALRTELLEELQ